MLVRDIIAGMPAIDGIPVHGLSGWNSNASMFSHRSTWKPAPFNLSLLSASCSNSYINRKQAPFNLSLLPASFSNSYINRKPAPLNLSLLPASCSNSYSSIL